MEEAAQGQKGLVTPEEEDDDVTLSNRLNMLQQGSSDSTVASDSVLHVLWRAKKLWEDGLNYTEQLLKPAAPPVQRDEDEVEITPTSDLSLTALPLLIRALVLDSRACYYSNKMRTKHNIQQLMVEANKAVDQNAYSTPLLQLQGHYAVPIMCAILIAHQYIKFADYTSSLNHITNAIKGVRACRSQFGSDTPKWMEATGIMDDKLIAFLHLLHSEALMGICADDPKLERLSDVKREAELALQFDERNADAHMNIGWFHQVKNEHELAAHAYRAALPYLCPDDVRTATCKYAIAWAAALGGGPSSNRIGALRRLVADAIAADSLQKPIFGKLQNTLRKQLKIILKRTSDLPDGALLPPLTPIVYSSDQELSDKVKATAPVGTIPAALNMEKPIPVETKQCNGCGHWFGKLQRCSRCKQAFYCSVDCQRKHWKIHKRTCLESHTTTTH